MSPCPCGLVVMHPSSPPKCASLSTMAGTLFCFTTVICRFGFDFGFGLCFGCGFG